MYRLIKRQITIPIHILQTNIPEELSSRPTSMTLAVGICLCIGFVLISLAKLSKATVFENLIKSNVRVAHLNSYLKESYPLNKGGSIFLLLNYLVSFGLVLYFSLVDTMNNESQLWLVSLLIPISLILFPIIAFLMTGLITGEYYLLTDNIAVKLIGAQLIGVVFFVLSLVAALYQIPTSIVFEIVLWIIFFEFVFRIFKSVLLVTRHGVSWYYIILYFCTLEILPLFLAYILIVKDFD